MKNLLMNLTLLGPPSAIYSRTRILAAVTVLALSAAGNVPATTIGINLGTAPKLTSQVAIPFDVLNGVSLNGQTLSLDFMFANAEFVRLFTATTAFFANSLSLQTNGSGDVGFLDGTAELLDQQGNALQSPEDFGSASDNGAMHATLFPLLSGQLNKPLDFFGVHFDLTLPSNPLVMITGAEFQLATAGLNHDDRFGIGPGVPRDIVSDRGGTLLLFGLALTSVIGIQMRPLFAR